MRYTVEYDKETSALFVADLDLTVNEGNLKANIRKLRELVRPPAVLVYPYLGAVYQEEWYEISKETLTEPRIGQLTWESREEEIEEELKERETRPVQKIRGFGK